MNKTLLIAAAALLTASCASNSVKTTTVNVNPENCCAPEEVIDDCKVIFLDSARNALISTPVKILSDNNLYYIQDKDQNCIKVFDKDGHFVSQVNRVGRSSQEYLEITNFNINDGTVYILSSPNNKLYEYDIHGKYLNSYELDYGFYDIVAVNNDLVLLYSNYFNEKKKNYVLFDLKQKKPIAECDDYSVIGGWCLGKSHFIKTEDGIFTVKPFDYNVYQYDNNSITPVLSLTFDTPEQLPQDENIDVIAEQSDFAAVVRYYESFTKVGDNIFLIYWVNMMNKYMTAVNTGDGSSNTICLTVTTDKFPFGFRTAWLCGDALYSLITPQVYNGQVDAANAVDEESNFILLEYKLKCK